MILDVHIRLNAAVLERTGISGHKGFQKSKRFMGLGSIGYNRPDILVDGILK